MWQNNFYCYWLKYSVPEYLGNCTASTFNELWKYWTVRLCFGNWFKHIVDLGWDILHSAIASCRISQPSSTICFLQLPKHTRTVQYNLISIKISGGGIMEWWGFNLIPVMFKNNLTILLIGWKISKIEKADSAIFETLNHKRDPQSKSKSNQGTPKILYYKSTK